MVASLFLPPRFWSEDDKFLGLRIIDIVSGVSNGIVIPLFNQLYQWVSLKLNEAEGHRYSTQVCGDGMLCIAGDSCDLSACLCVCVCSSWER